MITSPFGTDRGEVERNLAPVHCETILLSSFWKSRLKSNNAQHTRELPKFGADLLEQRLLLGCHRTHQIPAAHALCARVMTRVRLRGELPASTGHSGAQFLKLFNTRRLGARKQSRPLLVARFSRCLEAWIEQTSVSRASNRRRNIVRRGTPLGPRCTTHLSHKHPTICQQGKEPVLRYDRYSFCEIDRQHRFRPEKTAS